MSQKIWQFIFIYYIIEMQKRFIIGVILAILAGSSTYLGQLFQKIAVTKIPKQFENNKYRYLLKNKLWLFGLVLYIVFATVFYMLAELFIGPVLIPGLMTLGLIVFIIASVKIAKEEITPVILIGTFSLIIGAILITLSKLAIDYRLITLYNRTLIVKITIFTLSTIVLWIIFNFIVKKNIRKKGIFKALAAGFPYVLTNFWILPLYVSMAKVFNGQFDILYLIFFIISIIILIVANILGITELQIAYKLENVNVIVAIQQIPIQIGPAIYYLILNKSFAGKSIFILILGTVFITFSGFLIYSKKDNMLIRY